MTGDARPQTQLYLMLPSALNQGIMRQLQDMLEKFDIACVLAMRSENGSFNTELLNSIVGLVQSHNVACLIDNDWKLALKLGADGVHLSHGLEPRPDAETSDDEESTVENIDLYDTVRAGLGEDAIVGGLCVSRHIAMTFGEQGAQYVALPSEITDSDELTAHEQIQWWSELFELPCVAWDIKNLSDIEAFVHDGADFIAVGDLIWKDDDPVQALRTVVHKLS